MSVNPAVASQTALCALVLLMRTPAATGQMHPLAALTALLAASVLVVLASGPFQVRHTRLPLSCGSFRMFVVCAGYWKSSEYSESVWECDPPSKLRCPTWLTTSVRT